MLTLFRSWWNFELFLYGLLTPFCEEVYTQIWRLLPDSSAVIDCNFGNCFCKFCVHFTNSEDELLVEVVVAGGYESR